MYVFWDNFLVWYDINNELLLYLCVVNLIVGACKLINCVFEQIELKISEIISQRFFVVGIPDTILGEKRSRWHNNLVQDVYVEEAVNVLEDIKSEQNKVSLRLSNKK